MGATRMVGVEKGYEGRWFIVGDTPSFTPPIGRDFLPLYREFRKRPIAGSLECFRVPILFNLL